MAKPRVLTFAIVFITLRFCESFQHKETKSEMYLQHATHQSFCKLNLCFVLDGSGSSIRFFRSQLTFSLDILAEILLTPIGLVATQYGSKNHPISAYTTNENGFVSVFRDSKPQNGLSAVSDGIIYCEQEMRTKRTEANVIIVMTDGLYNRGVNPGKLADLIRQTGNYLFLAVKVGSLKNNGILTAIGRKNVFEINPSDTVKAILAIEEYEKKICKP